MSFNPDLNKQSKEVLFLFRREKSSEPSLILNSNIVIQSIAHDLLGIVLDIFSKVNKTIGLLWKLHHILPRSSLLTI